MVSSYNFDIFLGKCIFKMKCRHATVLSLFKQIKKQKTKLEPNTTPITELK